MFCNITNPITNTETKCIIQVSILVIIYILCHPGRCVCEGGGGLGYIMVMGISLVMWV